jgi:predicted nucleotidyltransferase
MRLDSRQKRALSEALRGVEGEVYLFGSRVDDSKKGGDIDILVLTSRDAYSLSRQIKRRFMLECEEKLDVVVLNPACLNAEQAAFLEVIEKVR